MRTCVCALGAIAFSATFCGATSLNTYIGNGGFETSITFVHSCFAPACVPAQFWNETAPGWVVQSGGDMRPQAGTSFGSPAFINPWEGLNVGYTDSGGILLAPITLSLIANHQYELVYGVGRPFGEAPADYRLVVTSGMPSYTEGVNMWTYHGNTGDQAPGTWVARSIVFTPFVVVTGTTDVWLRNDGGGRITWDVAQPSNDQSGVPEPSTLALLGSGLALAAFRRRLS